MGNIEVTEAQRKKCTKCKHRALMPKDKNKNIDIISMRNANIKRLYKTIGS